VHAENRAVLGALKEYADVEHRSRYAVYVRKIYQSKTETGRRWMDKGKSSQIPQFQPSEFSAIMGAEICAVLADCPVPPLP